MCRPRGSSWHILGPVPGRPWAGTRTPPALSQPALPTQHPAFRGTQGSWWQTFLPGHSTLFPAELLSVCPCLCLCLSSTVSLLKAGDHSTYLVWQDVAAHHRRGRHVSPSVAFPALSPRRALLWPCILSSPCPLSTWLPYICSLLSCAPQCRVSSCLVPKVTVTCVSPSSPPLELLAMWCP